MREHFESHEQRLRTVMQAANDSIVSTDAAGRIVFWNQAAERMFGYRAETVLGRPLTVLMPERYHAQHQAGLDRVRSGGLSWLAGKTVEITARRSDGSEFPGELSIAFWRTAEGTFCTGILRDVTERKRIEAELQQLLADMDERVQQRTTVLAATNAELRHEIEERQRLEWEVLEVSTAEQRRIGQELHDGVGGALTGLRYLAWNLQQRLEARGAEEAAAAAELVQGIRDVLDQVQGVARGLVPCAIEAAGLVPALDALAETMEQQTGTECLCQAGEDVQVPDEHTAIQLYRIAQEALSNAVRHGRASRVVVSLRVDDGGLRLEIHDDGVGLGGEGASAQGAGLRIMRYRAGTLGGSLEVGPRDGGGTVVRCRIPGRAAS